MATSPKPNRFFFIYTNFIQPTTLFLSTDEGTVSEVKRLPAMFDAKGRQRVFDDFAAVSEELISQRITSPQRLGIMSGLGLGIRQSRYSGGVELYRKVFALSESQGGYQVSNRVVHHNHAR